MTEETKDNTPAKAPRQLPVKEDGSFDYDSAAFKTLIIQTVAPDFTHAEFAIFREMCRQSGLNPFTREIWPIKVGNRIQCMTGINGYYQIANRHPDYLGIDHEYSELVESTVTNPKTGEPFKLKHYEWIDAIVKRKGRDPEKRRAWWGEWHGEFFSKKYGTPGIWFEKPIFMHEKCADSIALRKSFPQQINGLYTNEEFSKEQIAKVNSNQVEDSVQTDELNDWIEGEYEQTTEASNEENEESATNAS